jgi:hypothetical protein
VLFTTVLISFVDDELGRNWNVAVVAYLRYLSQYQSEGIHSNISLYLVVDDFRVRPYT